MELTKEYNFIWYGQCGTDENELPDCEAYTLPDGGGNIEQVWQINDAGDAKVWDKLAAASGDYDSPAGDEFVKLECGHAYYIRLSQTYTTGNGVDIPHAYVSDFADNSHVHDNPLLLGTCETGAPGPQPQSTSIAHGQCSGDTINLTANVNDDPNYTTCELLADPGATFRTIGETDSNNVTYELNGSTLSYKIATGAPAGVHPDVTVTITADAAQGYEFANGTSEDTLEVKLQATVNALAPVINNFAVDQVVVNVAAAVPNNAVQFNAVPLVANAPAGAQLKFNVVGPNGVKVVDNVVEPIGQVAAFGDQFLHAGAYTVTAEIVDDSDASLVPQVITDAYTFTIGRSIASISVADIAHGSIDRDDLPDTKTSSVTALNISGDWSATDASNAAITATKVGDTLQSVIDTQTLGLVNVDNEATLSANGTKWNQVLGSNGGLTPASNEVTATCTITATVTDGVVFTSSHSSVTDNTRDTGDAVPSPTKITITHDNVSDFYFNQEDPPQGWKFCKTVDGTFELDSTIFSNDPGKTQNLGHAPGTFEFYALYDTTSVASETFVLTLQPAVTDGQSADDIVITFTGEVTQAIGDATFSGCTSIDAITLDVDEASDFENNNKFCTLTTIDCSVDDVTDTTLGIFTYTITNNVVNYWITDASGVQVTSTASLDVIANADNNFLIEGYGTKTISITLSGTVNAVVVPASIAGCDPLTKITLDQGATSNATTNAETCTLDLQDAKIPDNLIGLDSMSTNGHFNYKIVVHTPENNGLTKYALTYYLDSSRVNTLGDHTGTGTIQAELTTGTEWTTGDGSLTLTFEAEVNAVVVADDKLWIGFQDGGNSTYTNWYELDVVETQEVIDYDVTGFMTGGFGWNDYYGEDAVKGISDGTKYDKIKHVDPSGYNPFSASEYGFLSDYFATYDEMANAMQVGNISGDGTGVEFREVTVSVGRSTVTSWLVSFIAPLPYTSFQIASSDSAYSTELSSLMASGGSDVGYLQGVNITASPDRPSGALDATQQGKTYNSDLLNVFCNGCPPESGGEGVLLKIVQVVGAGIDTKSYNATSCSHGGMTTGNWQNSNLYYAGSSSASQGSVARQDPESSPIVINEMYFELASAATKLKLADGKLPDCD